MGRAEVVPTPIPQPVVVRTSVPLKLGVQQVSWVLGGPKGTPRNGEKIFAKNSPALSEVPAAARYLGMHIYPDESVELIPSQHYPHATEKGIAFAGSVNRHGNRRPR